MGSGQRVEEFWGARKCLEYPEQIIGRNVDANDPASEDSEEVRGMGERTYLGNT